MQQMQLRQEVIQHELQIAQLVALGRIKDAQVKERGFSRQNTEKSRTKEDSTPKDQTTATQALERDLLGTLNKGCQRLTIFKCPHCTSPIDNVQYSVSIDKYWTLLIGIVRYK